MIDPFFVLGVRLCKRVHTIQLFGSFARGTVFLVAVALFAYSLPTMAKQLSGIRLIAHRAGVHWSTVSRVLNPQTRTMVSSEVAERILKIAESVGYQRNRLAVGLKTRRSFTVGMIVPDLTNPVFPAIVRAVEHVLGAEGYVTVLADSDRSRETETAIIGSMRARQVDGLILATAHLQDNIVAQCRKDRMPFVLVNRTTLETDVSSVASNDDRGIHRVIEHLVGLNHRRIAFVGGPLDTSTGFSRRKAFVAALQEHRLKVDHKAIVDSQAFTIESGLASGREVLRAHRRITAIVAANDMLALGCYDALNEAGLHCPQDISVTGYNDMPFADRFNPPLTTVRIPLEDIGQQAAQLLLRQMRNPETPATAVLLEPALVVRGSTARAPRD